MVIPGSSSLFKNRSLISKMLLLNFIGIAAAMSFVLVFVSIVYSYFARQTLANNLLAEARLLAVNTAPMIAFHDMEETQKLAATFKEVRDLQRVVVLGQEQQLLVDLSASEPKNRPRSLDEKLLAKDSETIQFESSRLLVFVPVYIEQERIGTVMLESSLDTIGDNILLFVTIASLATVIAILLSAFILRKLQMLALAPIFDMSQLAERVARDKSYHLRAKVDGRDEIASLAIRFNQMLERIELWDKDLNKEIDERRQSERHLDKLARTDELTRLPNRLAFNGDLDNAVDMAHIAGRGTVLMFIDLDDFKQVNDIYGHKIGDRVLQLTAKRITKILRGSDRLYRLGGDEFAVLLPGINEAQQAVQLSQRIIDAANEPIVFNDSPTTINARIGASVGIALCPKHADTTASLLHRADLAMYAAKQEGKNAFRLFENSMEK